MTAIDPHRTLGVDPGATEAEIKRAYRRLAKLYHPDSAGERALPRFLAIQAAYEALVDDPAGSRGSGGAGRGARPPGPSSPWQADAARARATREAYRARARHGAGAPTGGTRQDPWARRDPPSGARAGGPSSGPKPGERARGSSSGPRSGERSRRPAGSADPSGPASGRPTGDAPDGGGRSARSKRRPKATIGSTSYDGADKEPFAPAWEGATWYGAGSGTYWTLNPKEYADPRKHGPEYQARSRRGAVPPRPEPDEAPTGPEAAGGSPGSRPGPDATGAGAPFDGRTVGGSWNGAARWAAEPSGAVGSAARTPAGGWPSLRLIAATPPGRIGLAILGWIPLGLAVAGLSAAVDPLRSGIWVVDLMVLVLLLAVPRLGALAALGSASFLVVGLVATPVLLAIGGTRTPEGTATALAVVLGLGWLGGLILGLTGRVELPSWRGRRGG